MERRELIAILSAAAVAAPSKLDIASYKPRFFTPAEYRAIDEMTEMLIPSDRTPGAREAGVRYFMDTVLYYADSSTKAFWKQGVAAIEQECQTMFGRPFHRCSSPQREALIERMAGEGSNTLQRFFRPFKLLTVDAFAMSDAGKQFFGYKGNAAIPEFPGCRGEGSVKL